MVATLSKKWLFAMVLPAFMALHTRADVILYDNLGKPTDSSTLVSDTQWLGQRMNLSGTESYILSSITLFMERQTGTGSANLSVYAGNSARPTGASPLFTLTGPDSYNEGSLGNTVFTYGGSFSLDPNQDYWVVLAASTSTTFLWAWTSDNTGDGIGFQTENAQTSDSGITWPTQFSTDPYQMKVLVSVPEPGTLVLGGIGTLIGTLLQRQVRRQRNPHGTSHSHALSG